MAYFKTISEMHLYRAGRAKKWADANYAIAVQAENEGNMHKFFKYRARAIKYYAQVDEYKKLAWLEQGKTF